MTKTKTLLGLSLAAVFIISMVNVAEAKRTDGGHLVVESTVFGTDGVSVWITLEANVHSGAPDAYGYAVSLDNGGFLVVASHAGAKDHVKQGNDNSPVFHVHYLEAGAGVDCTGEPLQATFESDLDSNLKIKNNMIHVTDIDFSDTPAGGFSFGETFGFTIDKDELPDTVCFTPV